MIPAQELRFGNWITNGVSYFKVEEISDGNVNIAYSDGGGHSWIFDLDECSGIPLTPEIFEKCGFEKTTYAYTEQWLSPWIERVQPLTKHRIGILNSPVVGFCYTDGILNLPLKSLHQFQNLYFALTNTELNINL